MDTSDDQAIDTAIVVPRLVWLKALALWMLVALVCVIGMVLVFWDPYFSTLYDIAVHGWPID